MMGEKIVEDVAELKAKMNSMSDGQDDIKDSIKEIAKALNELLALRKAHDIHGMELSKLRETSHKHSNMLQAHELKLEDVKRIDDKVETMSKTETDMRIGMAKNSVISGIVSACIVVFITYALNH